jgi:hypothetical protein
MALVAASVLFPNDTFTTAIGFYPLASFATDPAIRGQPHSTIRPGAFDQVVDYEFAARLKNSISRILGCLRFMPNQTHFPHVVPWIAAGADSLSIDTDALYEKLRDGESRKVVYRKMEGCNHGWDTHTNLMAGSLQDEARKEVHALAAKLLVE